MSRQVWSLNSINPPWSPVHWLYSKQISFAGLISRPFQYLILFWGLLQQQQLRIRVVPLEIVPMTSFRSVALTEVHLWFAGQTLASTVRNHKLGDKIKDGKVTIVILPIFLVVLDSDGSTCHSVQAIIDTAVSATRSLTIHVSQYTCQNPYSGGPPGCLQYHYNAALATTVTGAISNFGYDRSSTSVGVTTTHLSNQHYNICIRRPSGCHAICYTPSITIAFGLS